MPRRFTITAPDVLSHDGSPGECEWRAILSGAVRCEPLEQRDGAQKLPRARPDDHRLDVLAARAARKMPVCDAEFFAEERRRAGLR